MDEIPIVDARPLDDAVLVECCPFCSRRHYHVGFYRAGNVLAAHCLKSHLPQRLSGKPLRYRLRLLGWNVFKFPERNAMERTRP